MLITTTSNVEGMKIDAYLGIVTGDTILGANIIKDAFAAIRDVVGGRASAYERTLGKARDLALADMEDRARKLGADAVVSISIDYESLGRTSGMLMVCISGTAVKLRRDRGR